MKSSTSFRYLLACLASTLLQSCASTPPLTPMSASELDAWETLFSNPVRAGMHSLHDEPASFADGSKGVYLLGPTFQRLAEVLPPGITRYDDLRIWNAMCRASLIATATLRDTMPFLIFAKHGIATRSRFVVDDVVKAPEGIATGDVIDTAQLGGELVDEGERLRIVADESGPPLVAGQQYLLIVYPGQTKERRFAGPPIARKVGEMLYVEGETSGYGPLRRVSEYTQLRRSMADLVARVPCPSS